MAAHAIRAPIARLRIGRLDDARLAELAATGDERAFEVVYDRHHRPLLAFCRHMLGSQDESEDALQQTFLRAHRSLLSQGAPDDLRPWLFAIARNRCLTMLAARKAAAVPVEEIEASTEGLSAGVERRSELRDLLGDIARLPDDQRSALVLAEIGDLSHAEIARVIEVPPAKVKALVHQARTRLIADRDARETPCQDVRELLATASGGGLRRGPLRRHLAICDGCRAYKAAVTKQRASLAIVLPVLPSAGLKDTILGALGGGGGGGAAATAAGGAAAAGGTGAAVSSGGATAGLAAKLAIGAALAGGAGGGAVAVERVIHAPERHVATAAATGAATSAAGHSRRAAELPGAGTGLPGSAGPAAGRDGLPGSPAEGRGSENGQAHREAAAERREEKAQEHGADKQERVEAREEAKDDRAADKQTRVDERDQRGEDRATAKEERISAREERLAARPQRGRSGGNRTTNNGNGSAQQAPSAAPRSQTTKPQPVNTPKPAATPQAVSTPDAAPAPEAVTAPSPSPATGKSGQAKGRDIGGEVLP